MDAVNVVYGKAHPNDPLLPEQPQCSAQEGREEEKWKNVPWVLNEYLQVDSYKEL